MPRVVADETLDHLAPDDPAAQRSRRDLVRVHHAMRTRSILARGWRALLPPQPGGLPLRILELGAGDGTLLLALARSSAPAWPPVQLTLLDRQDIVAPATRAAYAALGWNVKVHTTDVLAWAALHDSPRAVPHWDLITTTLFLHHFEGPALRRLLAAVAARSSRFFACEPSRGWLALAGSHLIGAIGANAVTREDAVLSVHAGFRGDEISRHWPSHDSEGSDGDFDNGCGVDHWQLREYAAGLFSHCFSAQRTAAVSADAAGP